MIICIGAVIVAIGLISMVKAMRVLWSRNRSPFVYRFYRKAAFVLLGVGCLLIAINYAEPLHRKYLEISALHGDQITAVALLVALIATIYTSVINHKKSRRLNDMENRINRLK